MHHRIVQLFLAVVGGCFLLYGLYLIVLALSSQIVSGGVNGVTYYSGPLIFQDPTAVRDYIFFGGGLVANFSLPVLFGGFSLVTPLATGPLLWVGIGLLFVIAPSRRTNLEYMCVQIALWMISFSLWFPIIWLLGSGDYGLENLLPFFLVTLALSLILLALRRPVVQVLRRFPVA